MVSKLFWVKMFFYVQIPNNRSKQLIGSAVLTTTPCLKSIARLHTELAFTGDTVCATRNTVKHTCYYSLTRNKVNPLLIM